MLSTFSIYVLWNECGVDTGKYLYARRLLNRCPIALTKDMVGAQKLTYNLEYSKACTKTCLTRL